MPKSIHELVAKNQYRNVEDLLKEKPEAVNQHAISPGVNNAELYGKGDLPLTIAIAKGSEKMIRLLLQHGADPNQSSINNSSIGYRGFVPLFYVCFVGLDKILELIIKESRIPLDFNLKANFTIDIQNDDYMIFNISLVGIACIKNHPNIVKILLNGQADPNPIFRYCAKKSFDIFLNQMSSPNKSGVITKELIAKLPESTALAISAMLGNADVIALLLAQPTINVNQPLKSFVFNSSALNCLICSSYIKDELLRTKLAELLIDKNANFQDEIEGISSVHAAALHGRYQILQLLIENGAAVDQVLQHGSLKNATPLMAACTAGSLECMDLLLDNGANPNHVCYEFRDKTLNWIITPLFSVIESKMFVQDRKIKAIIKLLIKGADVYFTVDKIPGYKGFNALELAVEEGNPQIMKLLLNYIITHPHEKRDFILTKTLVHAVVFAKIEIIELLLSNNLDINRAVFGEVDEQILGLFPLIPACHRGEEAIVQMLLQRGANVNQRVEKGRQTISYPIIAAAMAGHKHIIELLIKNNVNIYVSNSGSLYPKFNPLSAAIQSNHLNILEYILIQYPNILISDNLPGLSPLLVAIEEKNLAALKILLRYGVNPNKLLRVKNHNAISPLAIAIITKNVEIIKLLVRAGCEVNNTFSGSKYKDLLPIAFAILERDAQLIKVLLECGANIYLHHQHGNPLAPLNSLQIAIINCDMYHRADILLVLLDKYLSKEEKKLFEKYINKDKVTVLFAAVLLNNISFLELLFSQSGGHAAIFINQKLLLGRYKGESPLAAAAFAGNIAILRRLKIYQCDWQQIIRSDRIPGRTILQIVADKVTDEEFKQTLFILNKDHPFFGRKSIQTKVSCKQVEVMDDDFLQPMNIRLNKNSLDLGNLFYQCNHQNNQTYYMYHVTEDLKELDQIIKAYPFDKDNLYEVTEESLITNLISTHTLRILQAIVEYNQKINNEHFIPNQISWAIRNILMHDFDTLNMALLNQLAEILTKNLCAIVKAEMQNNKKVILSLTSSQRGVSKQDTLKTVLAKSLTQWLDDYYSKPIFSDRRNEFQVIVNEIDKMVIFIHQIDNQPKFELSGEFIKTLRTSEMRIGAMYQAILKNEEASQLINQNHLKIKLEECRIIRDIIGHEYPQSKVSLETQINSEDIYTIGKRIIASRSQLLKLAEAYEAIFTKRCQSALAKPK